MNGIPSEVRKIGEIQALPFEDGGSFAQGGYLEARELATQSNMVLPSNIMADALLAGKKMQEYSGDEIIPFWTRELLAYPEIGGVFKKSADIVDAESGWMLPAKFVPKEAFEKKETALFIEPLDFSEDGGAMTVSPKSVSVISGFPQEQTCIGVADAKTCVPVKAAKIFDVPEGLKRYINRSEGMSVRPISRTFSSDADARSAVNVHMAPDWPFRIFGVKADSKKKK